jgi:hypothetical protein
MKKIESFKSKLEGRSDWTELNWAWILWLFDEVDVLRDVCMIWYPGVDQGRGCSLFVLLTIQVFK